ncbi:unnamed protein product, partial [Nippostrongylus brasiliensis]|uniref:DNA-directed RNA polymerase n=1 Tax=Nippostrongylus brasiliensis TaxID=27835 RepID=A0A0N4XQB0_NIPBR
MVQSILVGRNEEVIARFEPDISDGYAGIIARAACRKELADEDEADVFGDGQLNEHLLRCS